MPRGIPNQPRKNTAKKTSKKATKRAYTRKAAEAAPALDNVTDVSPSPGIEVDAQSFGEALHQAFENTINNGVGQFSASGLLDRSVMRDPVINARANVTSTVRALVDACMDLERSANATPAERDVATARQRLAVAEFELAMDGLETAIRGR